MNTQTPIQIWQVYYFKCHCTLPLEKYVVIVYVEPPKFFGFLINSEMNDYIIRQNLQVCEVLIKRDQHAFKKPLKKDSYVDCREICPVSESELFNLRHKKMILSQLSQ
ncbi:hypothetical protein PN36_16050 [Candidatus Thiomargarita nelsonii]|uniref:Uncharacterized protein n=1 Tax=Candidatus Thiomargarita nelsonii TaxID=1003181 RepID=A0A0A6P901_9GAMM|nr:hypothetical protein PN36_16050 [Candidatus Thiomargarita nelsonii]